MSEDDEDEVNLFVFSKHHSLDPPLSFLSKVILFFLLVHTCIVHEHAYAHTCTYTYNYTHTCTYAYTRKDVTNTRLGSTHDCTWYHR